MKCKRLTLLLAACLILSTAGCAAPDDEQAAESSGSPPAFESTSEEDSAPEEESSASELEPEKIEPEPESDPESAPVESSTAAQESSLSAAASAAESGSAAASSTASSEVASSTPINESGTVLASDSSSSYQSNIEQQVITLINNERTRLGLGKLSSDSNLTSAARIRSREMYVNDFFAHQRPDGREWLTVLQVDVPVAYRAAGENLATVEHNRSDYDAALDASFWYSTWENSEGHYANMIRSEFTHVGVGIYYVKDGNNVVAFATTVFAAY